MATVKKRAWTTGSGERKEAWRVRYVDQHGKTRTRQFDLKRDADAFRVKAEGEIAAGVHTADRASVTVQEAANLWITTAETNGCERGTLKAYREMVNLHIIPLIGTKKLSRLSMPEVEAFADAMKATRSIAMAGKAVRALSMILNDAQRRGLVAQNVAAGVKVKRPRGDKKPVVIPDADHLRAIIAAADKLGNEDPRLGVMVRVAMLTGIRQSEIRALTWDAIDFRTNTLSVSQRADRWCVVGVPKSDAGHRTIPIGPALVSTLKAWKLRCPPTSKSLVFPNDRKGIIDQKGMSNLFLAVQIAADLAIDTGKQDRKARAVYALRYGWHDLRHAAASAWIKQKIDLKRLQVWIGHATIQLTLDTYGHLITDAQEDAALAGGAEAMMLA